MKFALYIDPLTAFEHSYYTKELLADSFQRKGHELTIFVPMQEYQVSKALSKAEHIKSNIRTNILEMIEGVNLDDDLLKNILNKINKKESVESILSDITTFKNKLNPKKEKKKKKDKKKKDKKKKKEPLSNAESERVPLLVAKEDDIEEVNKEAKEDEKEINDIEEAKEVNEIVEESNEIVEEIKVDINELQNNDVIVDNNTESDITLTIEKSDNIDVDTNVIKDEDKYKKIIEEAGGEGEYVPNPPPADYKDYNKKFDELNDKEHIKKYYKIYNGSNQFMKSTDQFKRTQNTITTFPSTDYDVLLLTDTYTKKWYYTPDGNIYDCRYKVAAEFLKFNKKVLCIRDTPLIEYRFVKNSMVKHGICTKNIFEIEPYAFDRTPNFIMPLLSNLGLDKLNKLSRDEFYEKYNIDKNMKLLCLLPGKISKWRVVEEAKNNNSKTVAKNVGVFYNKLDELNVLLKERGYIMVSKLHTRDDYDKWLSKKIFRTDIVKYIDPADSNEMLTYAEKGISFGTTMVYQTYMFDLPVLEIGTGKYYLGWSEKDSKMDDSPLKNYDYGRDLVYGTIAGKFAKIPEKTLLAFLDKEYDVKDFKYVKDHPIYGNSYGSNIDSIAKAILKQF